jgi:ABC-type spermidine/putrescine transport system permease subunit I
VTEDVAPRGAADSSPQPSPRRRRNLRGLLAVPTFGWTLLFFVAPLAILLLYSFGQMNLITFNVDFGWTLDNYRNLNQSLYVHTVVRSVLLSLGATLGCLIIGYPVAYTLSRKQGRTQTLLLIGVMVPFWTSFVVRTYAWVNLLQNGGPIEHVLHTLRLSNGSLNILYSPTAVTIGILYSYLPLMILPLFVSLERIDPGLVAAASDLGASGRRAFRRVTLPLSMPGVIAGCILVGVPATGEYVIPSILGGGKTLMYGNVIADQFFEIGNYPFGAALAMTMMAVVTLFLVIARSGLSRVEDVT